MAVRWAIGVVLSCGLLLSIPAEPTWAEEDAPAVRPAVSAPAMPIPEYVKPFMSGKMTPARWDQLSDAVLADHRAEASITAALIWLARAEDHSLRSTVGASLVEMHVLGAQLEYDVIPAIDRLVRDGNADVRAYVASALSYLDTKPSRRWLLRLMQDKEEKVRESPRWALRCRLGGITNISILLARRGEQLEEWLDLATVPIATDNEHRFVVIDAKAAGKWYSIDLPAITGEPNAMAWIAAEFVPLPAGVPGAADPPSARYMLSTWPRGSPRPPVGPRGPTGGGSHPGWRYRSSQGATGIIASETLVRLLPNDRMRIWVRQIPMARVKREMRNRMTRPGTTTSVSKGKKGKKGGKSK